MKHSRICLAMLLSVVLLGSCSLVGEKVPAISANPNSEYDYTFSALNLGIIFDYYLYFPKEDKSQVTIWVERYKQGTKDAEPLLELSFIHHPVESQKERIGFAMMDVDEENSSLFLYGPSFKSHPVIVESIFSKSPSAWRYLIDDKKVTLPYGENKLLAIHRQSSQKDGIEAVDVDDEATFNDMLENDSMVLLLKIKIERMEE